MASLLTAAEYGLLVENSPVMVWRAGLDGKCDYFNETWLAFTGRAFAQEEGDGWAEGVHGEDLRRCTGCYLDHFRRRQPFEMEYRLRRHDGVYRWILDRGVPHDDDRGAFAGFIGSCVDVDERRRAQDARERRDREELALAHEFERWILAIVSHDIRNPLSAIEVSAKLLAIRAGDDEQIRGIADRIGRSTARITNIVADLLDLASERHHGGMSMELSETNLHTLCEDVAQELSTAVDHKISVECEGNPVGRWDPHRLTQAVTNLVGNAVKHGAPGAPIDVRVRSDDANAIVEVHNGGAIPAEVMATLFVPFAAHSGERSRDGLGLGLFIARSIARAHRGDVQVTSTPELDTTFRLVLPRAA
jgi:two-component system, OmpR family, sensor histidine kinase VicK